MKQFFLILSFIAVTIVASDSNENQDSIYNDSDLKKGFFGSTGLFNIKKISSKFSDKTSKTSKLSIEKDKNVIELCVVRFKTSEAKCIPIHSIYSDALYMEKKLVVLDPTDKDCQRRFHWGFSRIVETSRRNFLKERLKDLSIHKKTTCFFPLKVDDHHVSWNIKSDNSGCIPVMIEHLHEGECPRERKLKEILK